MGEFGAMHVATVRAAALLRTRPRGAETLAVILAALGLLASAAFVFQASFRRPGKKEKSKKKEEANLPMLYSGCKKGLQTEKKGPREPKKCGRTPIQRGLNRLLTTKKPNVLCCMCM